MRNLPARKRQPEQIGLSFFVRSGNRGRRTPSFNPVIRAPGRRLLQAAPPPKKNPTARRGDGIPISEFAADFVSLFCLPGGAYGVRRLRASGRDRNPAVVCRPERCGYLI